MAASTDMLFVVHDTHNLPLKLPWGQVHDLTVFTLVLALGHTINTWLRSKRAGAFESTRSYLCNPSLPEHVIMLAGSLLRYL